MAEHGSDTGRLMVPQSEKISRRKSTLDRLSAFFLPSLTVSQRTEPSGTEAVHRKPLPPDPHIQDGLKGTAPPTHEINLDSNNQNETSNKPDTKDSSDTPNATKGHIRTVSDDGNASVSPTRKLQKTPTLTDPLPSPGLDSLSQKTTPRLHKEPPQNNTHRRSRSSGLASEQMAQPSGDDQARSVSAQTGINRAETEPTNRASGSRPGSSNGSQSPTRESEKRGRLRRSWLPGRSRSHSRDVSNVRNGAWILEQNQDYNTHFLTSGQKVPELWNENGDVCVFLHAKGSGTCPSFKVPTFAIQHSLVFAELIEAEMSSPTSSGRSRARSFTGRDSLSVEDAARRATSSSEWFSAGESRLYLPVSMSDPGNTSAQDLERLISIRNMFAFLTGQPLVGTGAQPTLFKVLLNVAGLLREFDYTNIDGSTFGEAVDMSFSFLMEQMALADVRQSREKTLESLILGEQMRSMSLYNEAFAHAAGKYPAIRDLKSPLWEQVSPRTRQRLERAYLDLVTRQNSVNNRLESFEFPALFSGVANSATQYKDVRFAAWRRSFNRMRHFVLGYYKASFGNWPPKARSKKNPFTESGLNRQVLKILYADLCALYDLLADRESITTRAIDQNAEEIAHDSEHPDVSALRTILGEFDQSSPPVLPPIPFDLPMLPDMASIKENYHELPAKEQARLDKGLQDYELLLILNKAYDFDSFKLRVPFLEQFKEFEHKEAKGKPITEVADQRLGYWLFMYVVIQTLPMLVVDAPGLQFTEGVEYFLCQPAKGNPPWMGDGQSMRKRWYEVAGSGELVELSEDAVEFSIEGIYNRSHCWLAAKQWELAREEGEAALLAALPPQETLTPLEAPQSVFEDMDPRRSISPPSGPPGQALRSRTGSPNDRNQAYRKSMILGLEPVALPSDLEPPLPGSSRVLSARGPSPAPRPLSTLVSRSRSSGNLHLHQDPLLAGSPQFPPQPDTGSTDSRHGSVTGGSTFDDILKDMGDADGKPKKKRMFF